MLLVVGGWDKKNDELSSTEIQVSRSSAWKEVAQYPRKMSHLSGGTLDNIVYMTGGYGAGNEYDDIYKYVDGAWIRTGKMKRGRYYHAVSVINKKHFSKWCQ